MPKPTNPKGPPKKGWSYDFLIPPHSADGLYIVYDCSGKCVANIPESVDNPEATARTIVEAVNEYDARSAIVVELASLKDRMADLITAANAVLVLQNKPYDDLKEVRALNDLSAAVRKAGAS